jgi:hypothetical protein
MIRAVGLALVLAVSSATFAIAKDDDDDDKVPAAEVTKIEETLSTLGCTESVEKEEQRLRDRWRQVQDGHRRYQLNKDYTVILISRY